MSLPPVWPTQGAWSLPPVGRAADAWLDDVLMALRKAGLRTAWVPGEGGLVSNLSLIENCMLPVQWHERLGPAALESRFLAALQQLGLSEADAVLFRQRPAQASPRERQQALFLRALMQQPQALVIGAGGLRGKYAGEPLELVWRGWMSDSLLLYVGSDGPWPELPAGAGSGGG
jgi:hypothetical protein